MTSRRRTQTPASQNKENWPYQTPNYGQETGKGEFSSGKFGHNANETDSFRDRTREFQSVARSIFSRKFNGHVQPLQSANNLLQRSQFMMAASKIGGNLAYSTDKLEKLTFLVNNESLYEDYSEEIRKLTSIIQKDITQLNSEIEYLQRISAESRQGGKHKQMHTSTIVIILQSRLARMSGELKNILKIRTEKIKERQAKEQHSNRSIDSNPSRNSVQDKKSAYVMRDEAVSDNGQVNIDMGNSPSLSPYNNTMEQQAQAYMRANQERSDDMVKVEQAIVDIGGIYERLALMIHEQEEMVQRL
ncbi:DgyrCDS4703 [Dimorphilus gyrociliatus]|uniref:DgyrCDS4703 n=1 Tax=Dimorphilus gyrociliatus TaxID=2664684 RepID=A0A7I8VI91_9ANNE|nr:DgyrCDS4703 [Dimorphilus gyrociliatus]